MRLAPFVVVLAVTSSAQADDAPPPRAWGEVDLHAGRMPSGPHERPSLLWGIGARGVLFGRAAAGVDVAGDASWISPECDGGDRFSESCSGYRLRALGGLRVTSSRRAKTVGFFRVAAGAELLQISVRTTDNDEPSSRRSSHSDTGLAVEGAVGFLTGGARIRAGAELAANLALHDQPNALTGTDGYAATAIEVRLVLAFAP